MLRSEQGEQMEALQNLRQISLPEFSGGARVPINGDTLLSVALTLNNLAIVNARLQRTDEAVGCLRQAIRLLRGQHRGVEANLASIDPRLQCRLADAMSNLSTLMSDLDRDVEALSLAQQAVRLRSALPLHDTAASAGPGFVHAGCGVGGHLERFGVADSSQVAGGTIGGERRRKRFVGGDFLQFTRNGIEGDNIGGARRNAGANHVVRRCE